LTRRLLLVCAPALLAVLVLVPAAWPHAVPIGSDPPYGSVLASSPRVVDVFFDAGVRVGARNRVIRNEDGADVMAGRPFVRDGRTLVIPLRPDLPDGTYTVRWSIVSDDGHQEEGVLAFGIGTGTATPVPALSGRGFVTWQRVTMRIAFFLGLLVAVGTAFFGAFVLRPLRAGPELWRAHTLLLGASLLLAAVGADALVRATTGSGTRFENVLLVVLAAGLAGAAAAAAALRWRRAIYGAWAAAAVLFVCPTFAGHALDDDQPTVLAPLGDLLHVGAASVWVGGLASLLAFPAAAAAGRREAARRFSGFAGATVLVLVVAGVSRALTELDSVGQLWETSYGRAVLLKVGLLVVLLVLGWTARRALARGGGHLRLVTLAELLVITVVVGAVGALTDLPPGIATAKTPQRPAVRTVEPPPAPPRGAFVDARQAGPLAVGFSHLHGVATVTLTGRDGNGAGDVPVAIDGREPESCGRGCFSLPAPGPRVGVSVGGTELAFRVPAELRPAAAELARLRRDYDGLRSVVIDERLSSGPGSSQTSRFREQAPDRMAYRIEESSNPSLVGSEGIVIGERRWDRLPGAEWQESPQTRLDLPRPYWTARGRNAFFVGPNEISFYDPTFPAWFRLRYDPESGRVTRLAMVATAHFMQHAYSGFDRPLSISPPASR
jgi:copper transport protein